MGDRTYFQVIIDCMADEYTVFHEIRNLFLYLRKWSRFPNKINHTRVRNLSLSLYIHSNLEKNRTLTMHHIRFTDTAHECPIVRDAFPLTDVRVEKDGTAVVDDTCACEGGFGPVWPDTDHLAVDSEVFARSRE